MTVAKPIITNSAQLTEFTAQTRTRMSDVTKINILVSMGTCGIAAGTTPVLKALEESLAAQNLTGVKITRVGCMGLCHSEPTIEVVDTASGKSVIYGNVKASHAEAIVAAGVHPAEGLKVIERGWYYPEDEENTQDAPQARIVLRNSGRINPEDIQEYIAQSGYQALCKVLLEMSPKQVVAEITDSGLRGRGGGGFPTGRKWSFANAQKPKEKYVICNADEGDPGAFMDRAILEGDPHAVLEAMAIAGFAIGAKNGIVYIRAEYPLAIERLQIAIHQAREMGFLGKNIFGSGFDFDIDLKFGAGAFVCGEETALIASIEGKRGEPTYKPPFPAIAGLWGKPTIVNNVETFANVCAIIRNGAGWFKRIGTTGSPGTKVFALAGKINQVGLIEVPMGTSLREIIYGIGKGIRNGKQFKAVQTGGPSGGCIKRDQLDTTIDYDTLVLLGSMMGSGGMIIMDEDDCMVSVARFFLEFTLDESCGKCTPCRIGNKRLHEMLTKITQGKADMQTLQKLRDLSASIKDTALCGLGQSSPNPVRSTMNQFEDEYLAHILEGKCPAGVCADLVTYSINENCTGCAVCKKRCPVDCIRGEKKSVHVIDAEACIKCGMCLSSCKFNAIDRK